MHCSKARGAGKAGQRHLSGQSDSWAHVEAVLVWGCPPGLAFPHAPAHPILPITKEEESFVSVSVSRGTRKSQHRRSQKRFGGERGEWVAGEREYEMQPWALRGVRSPRDF